MIIITYIPDIAKASNISHAVRMYIMESYYSNVNYSPSSPICWSILTRISS